MKNKLILLEKKYPYLIELHRYEINQTRNIVLTTTDLTFAKNLVKSYNSLKL